MSGFLFLQYGPSSTHRASAATAADTKLQLAAASYRSDSQEASRGSRRSSDFSLTTTSLAAQGDLASSLDLDMLTTTTVAPTTTTVAPTTTVPPTTTTVKPTTTTTRPKPTTTQPPTSSTPPPVSTGGDDAVWQRLANCESGGNPKSIGGGGAFRGAFQFTLSTWHSVGMAGDPITYSYADQLQAAKILQARSGWGNWPVCSKVALRG